jgi:hypothetical protein
MLPIIIATTLTPAITELSFIKETSSHVYNAAINRVDYTTAVNGGSWRRFFGIEHQPNSKLK